MPPLVRVMRRFTASAITQNSNLHLRTISNAAGKTIESNDRVPGALAGIKILDLSRVLAAPFCTQILADYGAQVIKIEDVAKGDETRGWKAQGEEDAWKSEYGPMSNYFAGVNRNKRSICLDLKHEKGKEIFMKLAKEADVIIENFKPGTMDRLGLGYEFVKNINRRVIYATLSGYGPEGPYADRGGYDMIAAAEGGLLHVTGPRNGSPVRCGLGVTDISTGLFLHGAILAAIYSRERTGLGQRVDSSLFETQLAMLTNVGMGWLNMGLEAERWGCQHPSIVPYDAFKTKDLYFVCGAANDGQFKALCRVLGLQALVQDDRYTTNAKRVENRDSLLSTLNEVLLTKTTDEWLALFRKSGLPHAPINTIERAFAHPQAEARNMTFNVDFEPAKSGKLTMIGPPVSFSEDKPLFYSKPPLLGEHTLDILREIGISETEIDDLKACKVVREQTKGIQ
ncbi:hypothetical protein N7474_002570 [Penicillium riverlandense]|uniref:uncharacterized protein n=1 Tax=Penicillium riverlandense TaxID=1903569 RepID=UPI002549761B|nr:uncharacterized protein N7474_002570 [Penicillium riverlandense]KAJ5825432.1 hypothetical protein N7474_002570 [Penicillium riverlandense]